MSSSLADDISRTAQQENQLIQEQRTYPLIGEEYSLIVPNANNNSDNRGKIVTSNVACSSSSETPPLWHEIQGNDVFERKYNGLGLSYARYRPVRRDGSCFYRSAVFQILRLLALEVNGCVPHRVGTSVSVGGADDANAVPPDAAAAATTPTIQPPSSNLGTTMRLLLEAGKWKTALKRYFGDFVEDFVEVWEATVKKVIAIHVPPMIAVAEEMSTPVHVDISENSLCEGSQLQPSSSSSSAAVTREKLIGDRVAQLLNDESENSFEYIVCFARYGVSSFLRDNASVFAPFIAHIVNLGDDDLSVQTFCEREVDVVGGECDEVHLLAFSAFFKVNLKVILMDNNVTVGPSDDSSKALPCEAKRIQFVDTISGLCGRPTAEKEGLFGLGPFAHSTIDLLYRPGHYEILLP